MSLLFRLSIFIVRTEATSARQSQSAQLAVLQSGVGEMCGGIQQDLETAREDVRQMAEGAVQVVSVARQGWQFLRVDLTDGLID